VGGRDAHTNHGQRLFGSSKPFRTPHTTTQHYITRNGSFLLSWVMWSVCQR